MIIKEEVYYKLDGYYNVYTYTYMGDYIYNTYTLSEWSLDPFNRSR